MESFNFYQPTRIHFGAGRLEEVGAIVAKYGNKCLLVTTSNEEAVLRPLYDRVKALLAAAGVTVYHFDEVVPNPVIAGIEKAIGIVRENGIRVVLGVGGGSSLDTAKSVALFQGATEKINWQEVFGKYTDAFAEYDLPAGQPLPVIAVPTTAGTGSEVTQAMIISDPEHDDKMCIFHDKAFPREAIIDVQLMETLPPYLTATTGFDAFSHAFESYMREHASPYTKLIGLKAMGLIINSLPKLIDNPKDTALRENMALAEMFAGISLGNAAAAMPHPLSEIVGGIATAVSHGQCLATIYPQYIDYVVPKEPEKCADVARLFSPELAGAPNEEAAAALPGLIRLFLNKIGLDKSFSACGVTEEQMSQITSHFLLGVLPFGTKEELADILRRSY